MSRRSAGVMQARWRLLGIGLAFGAFVWTIPFYQEHLYSVPDTLAGVQDVALLLSSLPFLAAVCLTKRDLGLPFAVLDLAQVVLVAFLASFALLFTAPDHTRISRDVALLWIVTANVLTASMASARCFERAESEEKSFFWLVSGFLWALTFVTGALNYYSAMHDELAAGSPLHLLNDLPLLALTIFLVTRAPRSASKPGCDEEATFIDTACSMFIPACSLLLAASVVPTRFYFGLCGVVAGFFLYGVRSAVMLKVSLAAQHELLLANRSIQDQAFTDALTGIPNRRSFDLTLEREWKRAQRSRQPLALLMLDVDHFKNLNDRHGHLVGDYCLREIASVLRRGLGREADFAARYGGEEFAILLIDTGIEGGRVVGESLRRSVEQYQCVGPDGGALSLTVSVGVASEIPMQQEPSVTLVAAADKALYRAKRNGRNRVEVHAWRSSPDEGLLQGATL
jgi:diguanylate cyclase (GGDEF)-like protein